MLRRQQFLNDFPNKIYILVVKELGKTTKLINVTDSLKVSTH